MFADDTYFYLQVAWNFARGIGSTFNTIMPTNGRSQSPTDEIDFDMIDMRPLGSNR